MEQPVIVLFFCFVAHYKDEVYDAVLTATYKSLAALAESSGCEGDVIRAISSMSNASNDYQGTPRSPRMQSAHSRVSSALSEKSRPQTSLSQLSNMTWTTERTNEVTYLQWVTADDFDNLFFSIFMKIGRNFLASFFLLKSLSIEEFILEILFLWIVKLVKFCLSLIN